MPYYPKPGMPVQELDTPALVVELDALDFNIRTMAAFFAGRTTALRPHAKTHKCPQIALKQIQAGAIGITCAKVTEAEVMVRAGIRNILIANEVVGAKIDRLTDLASECDLTVAVDQAANVRELARACLTKQVTLNVLIEVEIGMNRCGVLPGAPVVALAAEIADEPSLVFAGLQAYEGHIVQTADPAERARLVRAAFAPLNETCEMLDRAGFPVRTVSGGGTGTYDITGTTSPVNEIQAGSYVFMDTTYGAIRPEFKPALVLLSSIVSRPAPNRLVADVGTKSVTKEFGFPQFDVPGASVRYISEEHAVLDLANPDQVDLKPGAKVRVQPSHCCTTTNLHDTLYIVQNGILVDIWPVAARGCSQ
jgi:D-serine deaminase-like pyridoxal phosphate-dependent protein